MLWEWVCLRRKLYEHEREWAGISDGGGGEEDSRDVGWFHRFGTTFRRRVEFVFGRCGEHTAWTAALIAKAGRYDDRMINVLTMNVNFLACGS